MHQLDVQLDITLSFCSSSQKVTSLNGRMESATIPAAKKADLKAKVSVLQNQVIKEKKKITEENIQKAIKVAIETAEVAASNGKAFCISRVNVGLDTTTMREAVVKVMDEKGIAVMVFSTDETANKALVYAGVPEKGDKCKQLKVLEWLVAALKPLKGKGGGGKGGLAQGQVLTILVIENLERNLDSMVWVLKSCASLALRLIYVLQDLYFLVVTHLES